jgi:hypothetical protein
MQGLQIQLIIGLDRHKAHRRPCYRLGNRFRIDEIAFVGLHLKCLDSPPPVTFSMARYGSIREIDRPAA